MGLKERLENAKTTNWLTDGFTDQELKTIRTLALISADIEECRNSCGLTDEAFREIYKCVIGDTIFGKGI